MSSYLATSRSSGSFTMKRCTESISKQERPFSQTAILATRFTLSSRARRLSNAEGTRIAKLDCGDVFGEAALISNQPRDATIRAIAPLDTVAVSREAFQELLMHLPGVNTTMQELMSG